jgi:hypothetical protein
LKPAFAALLLLGCAARAPSAATPASEAIRTDANGFVPFGPNCRFKTRPGGDATLVSCNSDELMLILPSSGWRAEPVETPRTLVRAQKGHWLLTVNAADASETQYQLSEHLEALYRGVVASLVQRAHQAGPPHFEQMKNGHLVLSYDTTATVDGTTLRMSNAWTALRRVSGQYLDYHVSWTGTPSDPAFQSSAASDEAKGVADLFFVTNGSGQTPPQ